MLKQKLEIISGEQQSDLCRRIAFIGAADPVFLARADNIALAILNNEFAASKAAIASILDQLASNAIWLEHGLRQAHATLNIELSFLETPDGAPVELSAEAISVKDNFAHIGIAAHRQTGRALIAHGFANFLIGSLPGGRADIPSFDSERMICAPKPFGLEQSFADWLGLKEKDMTLPFADHLVGLPCPPTLHGGVVIAALILAAQHHVKGKEDLRLKNISVEYLRSGIDQTTHLEAVTIRPGRRSYGVRIDAFQQKSARHIASALARFTR